MADKKTSSRKKPVSQKRVAVVLASLVGTLTFSAAALLLMDASSMPIAPPSAWSVAEQLTPKAPLQRGAWNYIIVYESGDMAGSVASLADGVLVGDGTPNTVRPKAKFHFVIDSARSRRDADGDLEVGTTWRDQEAGAPYAGWPDVRYHNLLPYNKAVGVCVVGNLNRSPISDSQHRKLVQVVRELQTLLDIPNTRVCFQWELEPNVSRATPAQKAYADYFRSNMD
jgi:hypothetical protein